MEIFGQRTHTPRIRLLILAALVNVLILSGALSAIGQISSPSPAKPIEVPVPTSGFHPEAHQIHRFVFPEIVISAQDDDRSPIVLTVSDERSDLLKSVKLPDGFGGQVEDIRLFQDRLAVVTAMVGGDLHGVVVVDILKGGIIDHFKCYSPSISPDGKYVAFIKFFPSHFIDNAEDHYMIYDVAASPVDNRPTEGDPYRHYHDTLVGRCLYPEGIGNKPGDNFDLKLPSSDRPADDRDLHHAVSENFFWSPDSRGFVFADSYKGKYQAVQIRILGVDQVEVLSAEVPVREFCPSGSLNTCYFVLAHADFLKSAEQGIELTFRGVMGTPDVRRRFLFTPRTRAVVLERTETR